MDDRMESVNLMTRQGTDRGKADQAGDSKVSSSSTSLT